VLEELAAQQADLRAARSPEEQQAATANNTGARRDARADAATRARDQAVLAASRRAARDARDVYWAAYHEYMPSDADLSQFEKDPAMARAMFWAQSGWNGAFSRWDGKTNAELAAEVECTGRCGRTGPVCGCAPTLAQAIRQECSVPPERIVQCMREYASAMSPSTPRAVCACCCISDIPIAVVPAAADIDGRAYPAVQVDATPLKVIEFVRYGNAPPGLAPLAAQALPVREALSLDEGPLSLLRYTAEQWAAYDAPVPAHVHTTAANRSFFVALWRRVREIKSKVQLDAPVPLVPVPSPDDAAAAATAAATARGANAAEVAAEAQEARDAATLAAQTYHLWHLDSHYVEVDGDARTASLWLCDSCDRVLHSGRVPVISIAGGCDLGHPEDLRNDAGVVVGLPQLSAVEEMCVQRRRVLGCALFACRIVHRDRKERVSSLLSRQVVSCRQTTSLTPSSLLDTGVRR